MDKELLRLFEDFVDSKPIAEVLDSADANWIVICACCLNVLADDEEDRTIEEHTETCPYRRAYELLERTGNL